MPNLIFDVKEIDETKTGKVNKSGYLYIGRKYMGEEVTWVKLKEKR